MTAWERKLCEGAFVAWDRVSAYGCAARGVPYETGRAHQAWAFYLSTLRGCGVNTEGL